MSQSQAGLTPPAVAAEQLQHQQLPQGHLSGLQAQAAPHVDAVEPDAAPVCVASGSQQDRSAAQQATVAAPPQALEAASQPKRKKKQNKKRKAADATNRAELDKDAAASRSAQNGSHGAEHSNQGVELTLQQQQQQQQQSSYAPEKSSVLESPRLDAHPSASALPAQKHEQPGQSDADDSQSMLQSDQADVGPAAEPAAEPAAKRVAKGANATIAGAGIQHLKAASHASHAARDRPLKKKQKEVAKQAPAKPPYRDITVGRGSFRPGQQLKSCLKVLCLQWEEQCAVTFEHTSHHSSHLSLRV